MGATVPPKMFNQPSPFGASNATVIGTQGMAPGLNAKSAAAAPGGSDTGALQSYLFAQAAQAAPLASTPRTNVATPNMPINGPVRPIQPMGIRGRMVAPDAAFYGA